MIKLCRMAIIPLLSLNLFALELNNFKNYNCDKTLQNEYFKTCYNYGLKSATASYKLLDGSLVNYGNIKSRMNFYDETNIPKEFRIFENQFTNSGFDRGHIEGDASFDFSEESLKYTYSLSNIVAQYPKTNRHSYLNVEKYQREKAVEFNYLEVLTLINYSGFKVNGISIPESFFVVLYNKNIEFKECFFVKNDDISYSLEQMKVKCK